ncbi:hypothetical protein Ocin01_13176 [Orchesella cincta]|uniref:Uncharacterized protein n=1 Tax=Orchesella cincta TaxID=48709 RepID=A0A1D2MKB6_ORCCI|nr:hypothetical protein Ocin01_13176 [Orchesella cincta]
MDSEISFLELGEEEQDSASFFHSDLEQRIGIISSAVLLGICLAGIVYLVLKIRRKDEQNERLANGGMFDRNSEMTSEFPYSYLSNNEDV